MSILNQRAVVAIRPERSIAFFYTVVRLRNGAVNILNRIRDVVAPAGPEQQVGMIRGENLIQNMDLIPLHSLA